MIFNLKGSFSLFYDFLRQNKSQKNFYDRRFKLVLKFFFLLCPNFDINRKKSRFIEII